MGTKKRRRKLECEAGTPICSNELVRRYSVNGSIREGETFLICGACAVLIKRTARLKEVISDATAR